MYVSSNRERKDFEARRALNDRFDVTLMARDFRQGSMERIHGRQIQLLLERAFGGYKEDHPNGKPWRAMGCFLLNLALLPWCRYLDQDVVN
jgi:hypothetical protein